MISIITLFSWIDNDLDMLKSNVNSVFDYTTEDFEFIILDNDCLPEVKIWFDSLKDSRIRIESLPKRVGVGGAYNWGIKKVLNNLLYIFDSDIHPCRKDWSQLARSIIKEESDYNNYYFNMPCGWHLHKQIHVKKICDFYNGVKDNVLSQIKEDSTFYEPIKNRLESKDDFFDNNSTYQIDSEMLLIFKILNVKRYTSFKDPLVNFHDEKSKRPKENLEIYYKKAPQWKKDQLYWGTKWSYIRDYGKFSEDIQYLINNNCYKDWVNILLKQGF